jgi:hypothetical protein
MNRSAFYAWGGPGTVRLLKTKYFSPKIDEESFLRMYDKPFLAQARAIFGVSDMFVSYSWGFSDEVERSDRAFTASRLEHFENIRTYAYVQGLNLVYKDFDKDLWCKSPSGKILLYSKGRAFTCPNNPDARSILLNRIEEAVKHPFHAIFVDNILFGLPPIYVYQNEASFFGCSCVYCQREFKKYSGYYLPLSKKRGASVISDYLLFRRASLRTVLKQASDITRASGKQFGINLYDPYWHTAPYYFGYHLEDIEGYLDYFLFENHALKKNSIDNRHIPIHSKPSFIVSYRKGIGRESAYTQNDMNLIFSEARQMGYIPCYKATEYKTKGVWHGLYIEQYHAPTLRNFRRKAVRREKKLKKASRVKSYIVTFLNALYSYFSPIVPKHPVLCRVFMGSILFTREMKKRQYFPLDPLETV